MTMRAPRYLLLAMFASGAAALGLAGCGTPVVAGPAARSAVAAALPLAATVPDCADGRGVNATLPPAGSTDPGRFAADSTMKKIVDRGYLRVATNGDVLNWGSTDPKTGDPKGYDVDLAAEIAKALDLDPKKTVYTVIPYSERQRVLGADQVDLVAQQMTITCGRWAGTAQTETAAANPAINLSAPYYTAGAKLLVRTDFDGTQVADLKGQPVCGTTGSTSLAAVAKLGVEPVEAPSAGQCLVKFEEGEVAAVVGDETTLAGFTLQDPSSKIIGDSLSPGQYGLGTQAGATDFTRFVNAVLVDLRSDGTLDQLYAKWMRPIVKEAATRVPAPDYSRQVNRLGRS